MAVSNSVSLSTNFNVDPYYDDFDESKNFYRVLFRPGLAVQARELTQMQTIIQNQIDRLGEHIFKEGSTVRGVELNYDDRLSFIKLRDNSANGTSVNVNAFKDKVITGSSTGITANVMQIAAGSEADAPNYKTLFIKYTKGQIANRTFANGEQITTSSGLAANLISTGAFGTGSQITLGEGIIYAKDHFIRFPAQTLILDKYTNRPSYRVGANIVEEVIQSSVDTTLLDPAQGSYNYAAPGADRLKLNPILMKQPESTAPKGNTFIEFVRLKNGIIQEEAVKPQYAQIRDYMARRTFDESGHYIVKGWSVTLEEHLMQAGNGGTYLASNGGNNDLLVASISPGRGYISGYDHESLTTNFMDIRKGLDFKNVDDVPVAANYGNYVVVDNVVGNWPTGTHAQVSLRSNFANAVSNSDYSTTTAVGVEYGKARVRHISHVAGTMGNHEATYNMYLYDIKMTANTFASVKSVYVDNAGADGKADIVLTSGAAKLVDTSFNRSVYKTGAEYVKSVRNSSGAVNLDFNYNDTFDVTIATDGTFTVTTNNADENWPYSTGALNTSQKQKNFYLVLNEQANSASTLTGTLSISAGGNTVTGSGTGFTSRINAGDQLKFTGYANTFEVSAVTNDTALSVQQSSNLTLSGVTYKKDYASGTVIDMSGVGGDATARTVTVDSSTQASFDLQETFAATASATLHTEITKTNGREIAKAFKSGRFVHINVSNNTGSTTGPWDLGFSDGFRILEVRKHSSALSANTDGTDVTTHFELDSGMRDNHYDHARLIQKSTSGLSIGGSEHLLVKMDYFDHDTSGGVGYFTVDSYPIDDVTTANTNAITTAEIPIYTSPVDGVGFSLRDCVDIRPRIIDSSTDTTTIGSATTNPSPRFTMKQPSGGIHYATPNDNWEVSLSYYLKRRDLVVIDNSGVTKIIEGKPTERRPQTPPDPADGMVLGVVDIAPYPSISMELAKRKQGSGVVRPDLTCRVTNLNNRRYTMRDIGDIVKRVEKVEYYTALSLLEKDTEGLLVSDSNGNDRFKNGMLVDNFTGHKVGNVYDNDYKIAIDPDEGEARPTFKIESVEVDYYGANSSGVTTSPTDARIVVANSQLSWSNGETITAGAITGKLVYQVGDRLYIEQASGDYSIGATASGGTSGTTSEIVQVVTPGEGELITLPYKHIKIIEQPYASTTRNPAGLLLNYKGVMTITPDQDIWVDTTSQPDVAVNIDNNSDNWAQLADAWGTQFGDWRTEWTGTPSISTTNQNTGGGIQSTTTTTTTEGQTREGLRAQAGTPISTQQRLGPKLVSVNVIPFMRSRILRIHATSLKPNTRVFTFFDGKDVNPCCMQTNSMFANTTGESGTFLTSETGEIFLTFRIPNSNRLADPGGATTNERGVRFRTGTKTFRLTDSITNAQGPGSATTSAEQQYTAQGMQEVQQDTVISTRRVPVSFESVTENRTLSNSVTRTNFTPFPPAPPPPQDNWGDDGGDDGDGDDGDGDPLAQSFRLDMGRAFAGEKDGENPIFGGATGAFLTKIDLFFASKPRTAPVYVELREIDSNGYQLTPRVVPFSAQRLETADINVSDDSSAPTPVHFPTPVYLLNSMDYAVVVIDRLGETTLWVSRIGEVDIISRTRIQKQPFNGVMYAASNNKTWQQIQEEDLKLNLYTALFIDRNTDSVPKTGIAVVKNKPLDMFSVANVTASFARNNEEVYGESTLTLNSSVSVNSGLYLSGGTSGANGQISNVDGTTLRIRLIEPRNQKYTVGETVTIKHANNLTTGVTRTVSTESTPTGYTQYYDDRTSANTFVHLANSTGAFSANTFFKGQWAGQSARILNVEDRAVHTLNPQVHYLQLRGTTLTGGVKFATITKNQIDTAYTEVALNEDNTFDNTKYVLSRTNEVDNVSGQNSAELRLNLSTSHPLLSPAIDIKKTNMITVENTINNDNDNEANTAGGNATARYITRTVTLADGQDADDVKLILSAYQPATSRVTAYYKIRHNDDNDLFQDLKWTAMESAETVVRYSDSENSDDFIEYDYKIPAANMTGAGGEVEYVNSESVTYTGFKQFAIKIVLTTSNASKPPRFKDLRAIALQV